MLKLSRHLHYSRTSRRSLCGRVFGNFLAVLLNKHIRYCEPSNWLKGQIPNTKNQIPFSFLFAAASALKARFAHMTTSIWPNRQFVMYSQLLRWSAARGLVWGFPREVPLRLRLLRLFYSLKVHCKLSNEFKLCC